MQKETHYSSAMQRMKRRALIILCGLAVECCLFSHVACANNLQVADAEIDSIDTSADTAVIQFDISWDNSWRDTTNYDAVWLFMKYRTDIDNDWAHATLSASGTNPSGFSDGSSIAGTTLDIIVPADLTGCFLQHNEITSGSISMTGTQLTWDYGFDGLSDDDIPDVSLKLFAVEMVYIPTGPFEVGDGDGSNESTAALHVTDNTAFQISHVIQNSVTVDFPNTKDTIDTIPIAIDGDDGIDTDGDNDIDNALYPTGYNAFYLMKYEITQGQYADFLNTLNDTEDNNRYPNQNGNNRHTISGSFENYVASRPDRGCNYLSWTDVAAYCDWSAQRPMTELEYEKAARGPLGAVYAEFAWGTTGANAAAAGEISTSPEDGSETITDSGANINYNTVVFTSGDSGSGPLRVGIFAQSATTTRLTTGAGFYGVMDLSGNIIEAAVSVGRDTGQDFAGTHGDGDLLTASGYEGDATNEDWPGYIQGLGVSTSAANNGMGTRGGSWLSTGAHSISYRSSASGSMTGDEEDGGRCARTAP
ncbi:formylglycine-generating enzyme family protein [Candidatus Omnitrophota bacterium]